MASGAGIVVRGTGDTELVPVEVRGWGVTTILPVMITSPLNGSGDSVDVREANPPATYASDMPGPTASLVQRTFPGRPPVPWFRFKADTLSVTAGTPAAGAQFNVPLFRDMEYEATISFQPGGVTASGTFCPFAFLLSTATTSANALAAADALGIISSAYVHDCEMNNWSPYVTFSGTADLQTLPTILYDGHFNISAGPALDAKPPVVVSFSCGKVDTVGAKLWLIVPIAPVAGALYVHVRGRRVGS